MFSIIPPIEPTFNHAISTEQSIHEQSNPIVTIGYEWNIVGNNNSHNKGCFMMHNPSGFLYYGNMLSYVTFTNVRLISHVDVLQFTLWKVSLSDFTALVKYTTNGKSIVIKVARSYTLDGYLTVIYNKSIQEAAEILDRHTSKC